MPSRSDKLDAMKLTASLTDFDFDIIDGINGKDVPKKALSGVSRLLLLRRSGMLMDDYRSGKKMKVSPAELAAGVVIWNLPDSKSLSYSATKSSILSMIV